MAKKEIHCKHCKDHKLLAKIGEDGKIYVWCKSCHKEVELEVDFGGCRKGVSANSSVSIFEQP